VSYLLRARAPVRLYAREAAVSAYVIIIAAALAIVGIAALYWWVRK
jgi:hypothetical protein